MAMGKRAARRAGIDIPLGSRFFTRIQYVTTQATISNADASNPVGSEVWAYIRKAFDARGREACNPPPLLGQRRRL